MNKITTQDGSIEASDERLIEFAQKEITRLESRVQLLEHALAINKELHAYKD